MDFDPSTQKISLVGLGRLGAPIAACFAARGYEVIGYDPLPEQVQAVNERRPAAFEPGLGSLLEQVGDRLRATGDLREAVLGSDITFLAVPTPTLPDGSFSLEGILPTIRDVGACVREKDGYHLVVIASTVMPGSTELRALPALEESSGRENGEDLGLCYHAVFVTMGHVIEDFLRPDMVLVGECDHEAGRRLSAVLERVIENDAPVVRMTSFNAELTKLALNVFVATKISFANVLARLCEQMPGGNVDVVTGAMQLDHRVGHGSLCGAIAYGGPFFARDNQAFGAMMRRLDVAPELLDAMARFNRAQVPWLADTVHGMLPHGGSVGVLGLAYKPDTDVITQSPGLYLCRYLSERGVGVAAHDPEALGAARRALPGTVLFVDDLQTCIERADLVVVSTPWQVYRDLPASAWARDGSPRIVVDCWRVLTALADQPGVKYVSLGTGPGTPATAAPLTSHPPPPGIRPCS